MRIVITGANRGLGLEFAKQWAERGERVFALARNPEKAEALQALAAQHPENLSVIACDVTSDTDADAAAVQVASLTEGVDLLVNNAGVAGKRGSSLKELDWQKVREVFEINTVGPLRITRAFLDLLHRGNQPKVVQITSLMGSIGDNGSGGAYAYRVSKAALNMANKNLALELAKEGIVCVAMHPGWVQTDMGGSHAPLEAPEAIAAMVQTIDQLNINQTGAFIDRFGKDLPW